MNTEQLREKLAELEHEQWEHLARYWKIEHPLIGVPYSELTEAQKDSDRKWADKALKAFKDAGLAFVVKDAELPPIFKERYEGFTKVAVADITQQDMLEVGFRQYKEIELT